MLQQLSNGSIFSFASAASVNSLSCAFDGQKNDGNRFEYVCQQPSGQSLDRATYPERIVAEVQKVGRGVDQRTRGRMCFETPSVEDVSGTLVYGTHYPFKFTISYDLPASFINPVAGILVPRFALGALLGYDGTNASLDANLDASLILYPWLAGNR